MDTRPRFYRERYRLMDLASVRLLRFATLLTVLSGCLLAAKSELPGADPVRDPGCVEFSEIVSGRDQDGYFVRIQSPGPPGLAEGTQKPLATGTSIRQAAHRLARFAGATVLFHVSATRRPLARTVAWRDQYPIGVASEMARAAGLRVREIEPRLWFVEPIDDPQVGAEIRVFVIKAGAGEPDSIPSSLVDRLVSAVPVLDGVTVSVGVYQTKGNRSDFLAVVSQTDGRGGRILQQMIVKMRVSSESGHDEGIDCLWIAPGPGGALLPGLEEDFDGDGVADFVVGSAAGVSSVLSGSTGGCFGKFLTDFIAVPVLPGAKNRIVVDSVLGSDQRGVLLEFDYKSRQFCERRPEEIVNTVSGNQPWALRSLAGIAGGANNVVTYLLPGISLPRTRVDGTKVVRLPDSGSLLHRSLFSEPLPERSPVTSSAPRPKRSN